MSHNQYAPLSDNELRKGRMLSIHDAYNSLSPNGKARVDALCDYLVKSVKAKTPKALFSRDSALELIWQYLVFADDPEGIYDDYRDGKYEQRFVREKMVQVMDTAARSEVS